MTWFRKRKREMTPELAAMQLRSTALEALGANAYAAAGEPGGAIMEIAFPEAVATLVCMPEGSTSLYLSSGGGVVGAGAHESVRRASESFRRAAAAVTTGFASNALASALAAGNVRFYRHGAAGLDVVIAPEAELRGGRHALSALYAAGQAVITAIRESTPST